MTSQQSNLLRPALLAIALVALVSLGCGGGEPSASVDGGGPTDGQADVDELMASEFELPSLVGDPITLADSAGTVRLIDFWATWCAPCREEIPMLNHLHDRYGDQGLTIIAISDEDPSLVREFVEENDVLYTNLIDRGGEVTGAYKVPGLPTAFLLDAEGRVVDRFFGPKPESVLEKKIVALLGQPAT